MKDNKTTHVEMTPEQLELFNRMQAGDVVSLDSDRNVTTDEVATQLPNIEDESNLSGLVLTNQEIEEANKVQPLEDLAGYNSEVESNIAAYLEDMDANIEGMKEEVVEKFGEDVAKKVETSEPQEVAKIATEAVSESEEEDEEEDEEARSEEFNKKYNEAIILIDKTGMGVVDFTDDEREKLEKVNKIKLTEVEEVSLETIKIKKTKKKKDLTKILKSTQNTIKTTNIVLPASGYTAVIKGCSSYELLELIQETKDAVSDNKSKWTLIYNKIEDTSLGKFSSFDDFLKNTSAVDYKIFIYGILCATYPDMDTVPLVCQKCNKEFTHNYSIKSLIRAEQMTEKLAELVANTIDNSHSVTDSKKFHKEEAPISKVKRYKLPQSEIVVDLHVQSAHDFIFNSLTKLKDKKETKYAQASILSTIVRSFYIPDAEDGEYYEIDGPNEITEVIYSLVDIDMRILNLKIQEVMEDKQIDFGFMDMNCSHCGNHVDSLPMDVEKILFFKYQKALDTEIE